MAVCGNRVLASPDWRSSSTAVRGDGLTVTTPYSIGHGGPICYSLVTSSASAAIPCPTSSAWLLLSAESDWQSNLRLQQPCLLASLAAHAPFSWTMNSSRPAGVSDGWVLRLMRLPLQRTYGTASGPNWRVTFLPRLRRSRTRLVYGRREFHRAVRRHPRCSRPSRPPWRPNVRL